MNNPYFPVPFSPGMLAGSADATYPHLLPRFTLADGSVLAPLAFFKNAEVTTRGRRTVVSYRQDELDRMGGNAPVADPRLKVQTRYVFEPGRITRTDVYSPTGPLRLAKTELEFATFSAGAQSNGGAVTFGSGDVRRFEVKGLDGCTAAPATDPVYRAPTGAFQTRVACQGGARTVTAPFTVSWTLNYQP
jgi:hypothetical protein